jgi:hypothetical protein
MLQVHVPPAQPEHLAAAQTIDKQQDKHRIQPVGARGLQESERLTGRPRLLTGRSGGNVTSRATLRETSSSRMARVSAAPRTVRMTCTLAMESPAARRLFSHACTTATDSRSSRYRPKPGRRYSRVIVSYLANVVGRTAEEAMFASQ